MPIYTDEEIIKRREYHREYRKNHPQKKKYESQKKAMRTFYAKNKEELLKTQPCLCGGKYSIVSESRHKQTKIHKKYLANNPQPQTALEQTVVEQDDSRCLGRPLQRPQVAEPSFQQAELSLS